MLLWPNICNHYGLAVTSYRVLEQVSKFALSIRNMISLFLWQCHDNLLEKGERFVNELCLEECSSFWTCLLGSFGTSQVNQVQFADNDFFCRFYSRSDFEVHCENAMWSWWGLIEFVFADCSIGLTFEELSDCIFLCETFLNRKSLDLHIAIGVLLNGQASALKLHYHAYF